MIEIVFRNNELYEYSPMKGKLRIVISRIPKVTVIGVDLHYTSGKIEVGDYTDPTTFDIKKDVQMTKIRSWGFGKSYKRFLPHWNSFSANVLVK